MGRDSQIKQVTVDLPNAFLLENFFEIFKIGAVDLKSSRKRSKSFFRFGNGVSVLIRRDQLNGSVRA